MFTKKKYLLKPINIFNNEKGMALIATIIFVSILVSFGVAILALTNNDSKLSTLHRESNRAFYIAEKGIEKSFYNLNEDDDYPMTGLTAWRPDENSPYSFESTAEEYFLVTIENIGESMGEDAEEIIKITSTGIVDKEKFNSARRKIEVIAQKDHFEYAKYKYAILTDKLIYGHQSPIMEGDIHSNDDIEIPGIASGKLDYDGLATSSGDVNDITEENTYLPRITLPTIEYDTLKDIAEGEGSDHIHNAIELKNEETETWTGLHYIIGDLRLKNSASINITNGAIIVEGKVIIDNSASITISKPEDLEDPFYEKIYSPLAIVATGEIVLQNSSTTINGVVQSVQKDGSYTLDNKITVKNFASIFGSAIAQEVELKNEASIIYDGEKLSKVMEIGDEFYKKISWREAYL